jgi:hypothetical protein
MIRGSCLCGAIIYEAEALSGPIVHCHCRTCRKAQSAAFNTSARVRRGEFRWTQGEEALRAFASSPGKLRWFCANCGSHLMSEWTDRPEVVVRIGSVDEGLGELRPTAHIWVSEMARWDEISDDLARYPGGPPPA